jgi:hypothetical protein
MLGRGVGLVELVERARDRALGRDAVFCWYCDRPEGNYSEDAAEQCQQAALAVADEVCSLALGGQFRLAARFAACGDVYVYAPAAMAEHLAVLDQCPEWAAFVRAVELAERIDSYLAVMQADRRTAALAQDCRGELDLLGVLADLCEDAGLPRAAAEARQLHELARSS